MTEADKAHEAVRWLKNESIPLDAVVARKSPAEMSRLKKALAGVRVLGLADTTHGTKEFYVVRLELLKFLVAELGFRAVAIEGSYSAGQALNDYVLGGPGDLSSLVTALRTVVWDVEEFVQALAWMRDYNSTRADADKVRFYGADIWNTRAGRKKILTRIGKVTPEMLAQFEEPFAVIGRGEDSGLPVAYKSYDEALYRKVAALSDFVAHNKDRFVEHTSLEAYDDTVAQLRVIRRWLCANLTAQLGDEVPAGIPPSPKVSNVARSRFMGENLADILEGLEPGAKVVVWAHIYHLGLGAIDPAFGEVPNMGSFLGGRFGDAYYACCMEFGSGAYLGRALMPDTTLGPFRVTHVLKAAPNALATVLSEAGLRASILDLRHAAPPTAVAQWLATPRPTHTIGWAYSEPPAFYTELSIRERCDGIIFFDEASATTPTRNAQKSVEERSAH